MYIWISNSCVWINMHTISNDSIRLKKAKKESNSHQNESVSEEENKRYILLIPFISKPSLIFKRKMCEIFKQAYDVEIQLCLWIF